MMNRLVILVIALLLLTSNVFSRQHKQQKAENPDYPYTVAASPWQEELGNHRVEFKVRQVAAHISVKVQWRRRDVDAAAKGIIVQDAAGNTVANVYRISFDREKAELAIGPVTHPGTYYLYYLPVTGKKNIGWWEGRYNSPEASPSAAWLQQWKTDSLAGKKSLVAEVVGMQSRTAFDSFFPMEVCASAAEANQLRQRFPQPFLVFPESREFAVRMKDDLPLRWIRNGPSGRFRGRALRNEYYVFQLAVYAARDSIADLQVAPGSHLVTSFNSGGINARGQSFKNKISIPRRQVQALWFGVDVPRDTNVRQLKFPVILTANGVDKKIEVVLDLSDSVLQDRGDGEPWRLSRLRWLNSTLGIDDLPVAPYAALARQDRVIKSTSATLEVAGNGLPGSLLAGNRSLLAAPMELEVEDADGLLKFTGNRPLFEFEAPGKISWVAITQASTLQMTSRGRMEFDGTIQYRVVLKALRDVNLKDIRLDIPVQRSTAQYFMGMGRPGGFCPELYEWKWKGPQDAWWIGAPHAGLHVELQGASYTGPLLNLYKPSPPPSWYNNDKGGFSVRHLGDTVHCVSYSGARTLAVGDSVCFDFKLLVTPVKQLNTHDQFADRYFHNGNFPNPSMEDLRTGIKIVNLHHANPYNPYINYPFLTLDSLRYFIRKWHAQQLKVKLYYTIREITNQLPEIWALRSLGDEILADGKGGGFPWLREHLGSHYDVQWFTPINGYQESDAAIRTSGESRWYNYYTEGLRWLVANTDIDGLYLDDVAFDRFLLQRMRKVMDATKPGCLLDLHSNTGFSKGPATQYTEFFPYINKLWFGESFQYDKMPADNWLVEVSGIPFGLMGDMLQGGGNPWRGMVYGMTVRYPWSTEGVYCDPRDIWKIWDSFNIAAAKMIGYWEKDCPVTTSDSSILATVYVQKNALLVAIGSWAEKEKSITLNINWKALSMDSTGRKLVQSAIPNFQEQGQYRPGEAIIVKPGKGLLLEIR
ncbi:glycoside hydrolase domain-containing protein [Flavihumibacter petaseus]|uniref:Glycoside hydrolase 123-like N-terminal domain-containing protein n=1 Tax=Flavihumibacter petaseus NBRC 106054 TaxID=1220578 RepID=A0A0E9N2H8_9BACT|nr:glycoside hydrolase domain-containing protein [Flavihumibacter petaseus]GAO43530.1 hypothetical protein FPE01S_02_06350 [Flavihumibacter petaseus NBRC 106054]